MKSTKKAKSAKSKNKSKKKFDSKHLAIAGVFGILFVGLAAWLVYRDAVTVTKQSRPQAYVCPRISGHHQPLAKGSNDSKSNAFCVHYAQELYNMQTFVAKGEGPNTTGAVIINGKYDASTAAAIKSFQTAHPPLKATGSVDFYTWNALEGAVAPYDKTPYAPILNHISALNAPCPYGQLQTKTGCQTVIFAWNYTAEHPSDGLAMHDVASLLEPAKISEKQSKTLPSFWQNIVDGYVSFVSK